MYLRVAVRMTRALHIKPLAHVWHMVNTQKCLLLLLSLLLIIYSQGDDGYRKELKIMQFANKLTALS